MVAGPFFGAASGTSTVSRGTSAEPIELMNGFEKLVFWRKKTDARAQTSETLSAFGIAKDSSNAFACPLESVSESITEEVMPHEAWTETAADNATQALPLVGCDAIVVIRKEQRFSVSGTVPNPMPAALSTVQSKLGKVLGSAYAVSSAVGSHTITIPATAFVLSFNISRDQTNWQQFQAEFVVYTANTGAIDEHFTEFAMATINTAFSGNSAIATPVLTTNKYRPSKTVSMQSGGFVTVNWNVELFPDLDGTV
jgi:DNA gyrase inhibitor GyrI